MLIMDSFYGLIESYNIIPKYLGVSVFIKPLNPIYDGLWNYEYTFVRFVIHSELPTTIQCISLYLYC